MREDIASPSGSRMMGMPTTSTPRWRSTARRRTIAGPNTGSKLVLSLLGSEATLRFRDRSANVRVVGIVEEKDASPEERAIRD